MGQLTSTINFTRYELTSVTDYRNDKFATARIQLYDENKFVTEIPELKLWEGAEYDLIGQWKDSDIDARISFLLNQ